MKHEIKIIITLGCNSKCSYCYEKYAENPYDKKETLKTENLEKLLKFIKKYILLNPDISEKNKLTLVFYGGECLLHPEKISSIIEGLKIFWKKILFCVFTNGILINKRISLLNEINSLENISLVVRVSFDYYLQNTQRKDRTHSLILKNLRLLLDSGIKTETSTVLNSSNNKFFDKVYDDYKDFYDNLSDSQKCFFNSPSYDINYFENLENFDFSASDKFLYVKSENEKNVRPSFHKLPEKILGNHEALSYTYNIHPSGLVYISESSHYLKDENGNPYDFILGNYLENDVKEIMENQKKYLEKFKENKDILRCSECSCSSICSYQPFLKINETYCKVMEFIKENS